MIQQTSLFAYQEVKRVLGPKQQAIYDILRVYKRMTDKQLAEAIGWPINEVTPRRNELVKKGLVIKGPIVKQDGRSAISWEVGEIL